jgi:hypothetical protein
MKYTIYLVPETNIEDPIQARLAIIQHLQASGIIDEEPCFFYQDSEGRSECYGVGSNDLLAFDIDENQVDIAFEQCIIYGHQRPTVVPQEPASEPSCPACGQKLWHSYEDFINSTDDLTAPLACDRCGKQFRIDALNDPQGIFITTLFISSDDTNGSSRVKAAWLQQFNELTGIRFKAVEYEYT